MKNFLLITIKQFIHLNGDSINNKPKSKTKYTILFIGWLCNFFFFYFTMSTFSFHIHFRHIQTNSFICFSVKFNPFLHLINFIISNFRIEAPKKQVNSTCATPSQCNKSFSLELSLFALKPFLAFPYFFFFCYKSWCFNTIITHRLFHTFEQGN